ncbi:PREDICTED: TP53-target gene 5 protein [Crocodylus porosus]|uniref:TP53-target gene 5 protein n=1 Tax=Crocodylus porosus TaxID=8502 RepID=UPI00093FB3BE|nr:PREDICTED: TP53-target gene 5 protein [Crocodylus porosus]
MTRRPGRTSGISYPRGGAASFRTACLSQKLSFKVLRYLLGVIMKAPGKGKAPMQQIDDAEAGSSRLWLPHSSTTKTGACQLSNKVQKKNRLKKILKKLSLLKLIKQADRRILRLRVLASRCWKLLTFEKPASLVPGPAGTKASSMEPKKPGVDADTSPVVNTATETDPDITDVSPTTHPNVETAPIIEDADPVTIAGDDMEIDADIVDARPASEDDMMADANLVLCNPEPPLEVQPEIQEWRACFEGLPQRLHVPAPKVLCRPAVQRWIKPCCTRSCGQTLEHPSTVWYRE